MHNLCKQYGMLVQANMTTRVPLMALLYHFETLHAASWEQTTT